MFQNMKTVQVIIFINSETNNMTPKEKAKELVNKFYVILMKKNYPNVAQMDAAKECGLILIDEILKENSKRGGENDEIIEYEPYWLQVKQEIENL